MAKGVYIGEQFDLPDDVYTGQQLQGIAGATKSDIPVVRARDERDDIIVGPDEKVRIANNDVVTFTTPMEAAMRFDFFHRKSSGKRQQHVLNTESVPLVMTIRMEDYNSLRLHLIREDRLERVSYIFFGARGNGQVGEIFVHRVINLEDHDYERQSYAYVLPRMDVLLKIFRKYEKSAVLGFMHVHSHPFSDQAEFSHIDNLCADTAVRSIRDYLAAGGVKDSFLFGRMVVGQDEAGFSADFHDERSGGKGSVHALKLVGKTGLRRIHCRTDLPADEPVAAIADPELLDRNIRWLGEEGQNLLSASHLVICGVGGAGSLAALNARGMGFRKITLVDHDRIEKSNLNRLPAASLEDVGNFKVHVMERMIKDVSPHTEVEAIAERIPCDAFSQAVASADMIVSAVDSFAARFQIQLLAARYLKPLIDIGAGIVLEAETNTVKSMGGQVVAYLPGGPCLCCQGVVPREIESDLGTEVKKATGYVQGREMTPTAVATINSVMAGHALDMVIKYLTGFSEISRYVKCDMLRNNYETFRIGKRRDCCICGDEGVEGAGDEIEQIPAPAAGWAEDKI